MADVRPFPGLRYNPDIVPDLSNLIAPPYDVISKAKEKDLAARHPFNCIRLILGDPSQCSDSELHDPNRYTKARNYLTDWKRNRTLMRDQNSMYIVEDEFTWQGNPKTRKGLLCTVALKSFDERIILPHERTLSGPIEDRKKLISETQCQLSPVYMTCSDESGELLALLESLADKRGESFFDNKDEPIRHRLTPVADPRFHERIHQLLRNEPLLIADGHHRYTTALHLQRELGEQFPRANYVMVFLAPSSSQGFVLSAIHREVLSEMSFPEVKKAMAKTFNIVSLGADITSFEKSDVPMALYDRQEKLFFGLQPKHGSSSLPQVIFNEEILKGIFGIDLDIQAQQSNVRYIKPSTKIDFEEREGYFFALKPLKIKDILNHVRDGARFPQKSTYFYPKIMSGFAFHSFAED